MTDAKRPAREGGNPIRDEWLAYNRQFLEESDKAAVRRSLDDSIITRGPLVKKFEEAVAEKVGSKFAVAFNSGTAALHAACFVAGVQAGDRVITSPLTFAATANAVLYCGGKVDFQDVREDTLNLNEAELVRLDAKALIAVDFAGNPCDYRILRELQEKSKFVLIADAAHSLGGSLDEKPCGSLADLSCFSFHPVKSVTSGEGGMVLTDREEYYEKLVLFRNHGIEKSSVPGQDKQRFLGFNYHLTDLQAALGMAQLSHLDNFMERRRALVAQYQEKLKSFAELRLPCVTKGACSAWHLYPIRLKLEALKISRDEFIQALHAENIGVVVHYPLVYRHPFYQENGYSGVSCKEAEMAFEAEISLPLFVSMSEKDQADVCEALEKLISFYRA